MIEFINFVSLLAISRADIADYVNSVFLVYIIIIFIRVLLSWIRLPYSRTAAAVQEFLNEVVLPYIRLFRFVPSLGPFDLSPIVAVIVLLVAARVVNSLIGALL